MQDEPSAPNWGPHYKGIGAVADVSNLITDQGSNLELRMLEAVRDWTLMLVTGDPGTGKSFATGRAVERALSTYPKLQPVWLEMAGSTRGRALAQDLIPQITGSYARPGATLRDLRQELTIDLAQEHRVIVVDEAQLVTLEALQLLRWLHDRTDARFALVIVGTEKLEHRLPPEISSRVQSHVRFGRITDAQAPGLLAAYHPIFDGADPAMISRINRLEARGEIRWWAKFLVRGHRYVARSGETILTERVADMICVDLRKGSRK